ncbi:MAG: beta-ketoacyl-[acyl-carrier-protein] synthase family protein [Gemmataceae bacterium]|nr:beta-ketoacyl-[acyl-carrier-protein] synthase family protein [Gemmataceae bacterium]MCI0738138.1 beta-ketoacyl-[acyl-carrier-protein] synthase family protein [Gemmataceae bacterium]
MNQPTRSAGEVPVWVTGVGTTNPLGQDFHTVADNLLAGRSGIMRVTDLELDDSSCKIAGRIGAIPVPPGQDPAAFRALDKLQQLILYCATQALVDAGHWENRGKLRVGLVMGVGAEWLRAWELDFHATGGTLLRSPRGDEESLIRVVQQQLGLRGPATVVAAACASGNVALAQGKNWLRRGWVDVCLAGACDLWITPMALASFGRLRVLSRRNDEPAAASRPFDKDRDGFVLGEGGAVFLLESAQTARRRAAHPYAELAGHGATSDAFNLVIPNADPAPASQAVRLALHDAQINPDDVDYINAHATSTSVGDTCEAKVIQSVFGSTVSKVPVSSTKSMTGHLLSAAAAMEALACLIALRHQAVPPTINLDNPDPECSLCHVPHQARPQAVDVAISNSFGFGGNNTCTVFRKVA